MVSLVSCQGVTSTSTTSTSSTSTSTSSSTTSTLGAADVFFTGEILFEQQTNISRGWNIFLMTFNHGKWTSCRLNHNMWCLSDSFRPSRQFQPFEAWPPDERFKAHQLQAHHQRVLPVLAQPVVQLRVLRLLPLQHLYLWLNIPWRFLSVLFCLRGKGTCLTWNFTSKFVCHMTKSDHTWMENSS